MAARHGDPILTLTRLGARRKPSPPPIQRVETAAKLGQQLALPSASGPAGFRFLLDPSGRYQLDHLLTDPVRVNAQAVQYPDGYLVVLADKAEQDVHGPEVAMTERDGLAQ